MSRKIVKYLFPVTLLSLNIQCLATEVWESGRFLNRSFQIGEFILGTTIKHAFVDSILINESLRMCTFYGHRHQHLINSGRTNPFGQSNIFQ